MPSDTPITVVVADDHPVFLDGVLGALDRRPDVEVVASAGNGAEALELVREHRPAVALLDLRLPLMTGVEVLHAIRRDDLPTRVLILSGELASATVYEAVQAGVDGYLTKDADRRMICEAIVTVAGGGTVLAPEAQAALTREVRGRVNDDVPVLSPREREVLRMIAEGLSGPEIAAELQIGTATVKTHTQNVYDKLGVSERAAAVASAMRRNMLE
ncbi:response regulator transcription factor [Patulibacter sp.]|uniref:response regulator transcription factor n=1 Tax=Patulibacter sp. TaxID=1912859 RepID=UPI00271FC31A|nr:response regulator transcription factor [Patulibacter sp.]MDO9407240.1 response regulator transcription factor [Patulibacter sp.]